jgi:AcrR family transcriptional regulator
MGHATDQHGSLRDRLREETAAAILAAAESVIAEDGLYSARIERIAERAGVSVGTIYNHFKDRTSLVQSLFATRGEGLRRRLLGALEATARRPALDQARALLAVTRDHGKEHSRLFGTLLRENHGPARIQPPEVTRVALAECSALVVERGIAAGELRDDPLQVLSQALCALARGAFACAVEGRGTDAEIDALAEFFVRGAAR